ncbi:hypothetical protein [Bacillus pseudomycoides]|uniref:hypothetical protein n=1 Tax=Bacillus pseudomycoides TaxID=64104 RepID=UPI00211D9E81|nr:hypothetical protein [Bacillus pseudomycoides]
MNDLAKELNETFQKYQVGPHEIAYWMYLTLERITEEITGRYMSKNTHKKNWNV